MALDARALRARRRGRRGPVTDINIAPFVDVMLVLVVIFMIAAPLVSVGVPIDLPKARVNPVNAEREPLVVTIDRDGRIFLQETEIPAEALIPRLVAVSAENAELRIFVRGDREINYGRIIEVMGLVNEAGFSKVALIAELPEQGTRTQ